MIQKLMIIATIIYTTLSAGLVEDGIAEARKGKNVEALKLFEQSCAQTEISKGCFYAGQAYNKGTVVPKDREKALGFFNKSCELGYPSGCMIIGSTYYYGRNVKKDYIKAQEAFDTACNLGDANGCFLLGSMYDLGQGIQRDVKKAKQLYTKACDYGSKMGCKYKQQMK